MTKSQLKADRIAEQLREDIRHGRLLPGQKLATVRALAEDWGVAYNTVSRAISTLKDEGLLTGVGGGPTRVRVQPIPVVRDNRTYAEEKALVLAPQEVRARNGVSERSMGIAVQDLHADDYDYEVVKAKDCPALVTDILQLHDDDQVLRRRYFRRHAEGAGASTSTSYIPYAIAAGNPKLLDKSEEPWPGGTFHQLWTVGREVGRMEEHISARMPTAEEQAELDIPPKVPLFDLTKITFDTQERPVEVAFIPLPADRVRFVYSTPLERW